MREAQRTNDVASIEFYSIGQGLTHMRIFLLTISIVLILSLAYGKEYGNYDLRRIPTVSDSPSGKKYGIDLKYLDQMLNDLALHAKNYPPQFDTPQDQHRAGQDIIKLSGLLDVLVNGPNPNPEFLRRAGFLHSMGYNLDIPGSGEKVAVIFKKLLTAVPSDPRGNYMYGKFLAEASRPKEALPYLETALSVGVIDAAYSLGLTYFILGDREKALQNLEDYRKMRPNDTVAAKIVDSIRSGKATIKYRGRVE